jgi:hypothetical protein
VFFLRWILNDVLEWQMIESIKLVSVAAGVWTMTFPLKMLGVDIQRVVTLLELEGGKLVVHSTAPFGASEVSAIRALGDPVWLVDALLRHDTFAAEGHAAFPQARYLAPLGFDTGNGIATESLMPPPPEWAGEIEVLAVEGAPSFGEVVMLHYTSKTLIVGDLIVNFSDDKGLWSDLIFKFGSVGGHPHPGVTKPFKHAIKDEQAFLKSLEIILSWDFERIIVGHGELVLVDAKSELRRAFADAGLSVEHA